MEGNSKSNQAQATGVNPNLAIYNQLREVPQEARKEIQDGRLKGKTDVNAMWRIKRLTEFFGPCGFGWKYKITNKWLEEADKENCAAFVDVELFVKNPSTGEWSEAIPGTGGNVFKRKERSGFLYMDDDCYKKALTDAISIAAKALGLAADVWYEQDVSKYEGCPDMSAGSRSRTGTPTNRVKTVLNPQSIAWAANVAKVASISGTPNEIRKRIETVYIISDPDFKTLLIQAGKLQAN